MEKKTTINGHPVAYDAVAYEGIKYLMERISDLEAKVFFDQAYSHGFAMFEDHSSHKYKLSYHYGEYQLEKA